MKKILQSLILIAALHPSVFSQTKEACATFQQLIKSTYNFKAARLSDTEREAKSAAMDRVWNTVKANPAQLLPCLRASLESQDADPFFRFDGSNLLVSLDPSTASKALQVRSYSLVDLDDVDLRVWVMVLAVRGAEGFDTSEAGARWLSYPRAKYYLPEHGGYEVKTFEGALFLYGSMEESKATPALLRLVSQAGNPGREYALRILMSQATPESIRALKQVDLTGLSDKAKKDVRELLEYPKLLSPRAKPKTTREEFLSAFRGIVNGNWREFLNLVEKVPDGEKDVVAVMQAGDIPLIRQVRRRVIANANQHAIEFYQSFTDILMTLIWKYEMGASPAGGAASNNSFDRSGMSLIFIQNSDAVPGRLLLRFNLKPPSGRSKKACSDLNPGMFSKSGQESCQGFYKALRTCSAVEFYLMDYFVRCGSYPAFVSRPHFWGLSVKISRSF